MNQLREAAALGLVRPLDKGVTRMQAALQLLLQVVPLFCNTLDLGPYLSLYITKNILTGEKWVRGEGVDLVSSAWFWLSRECVLIFQSHPSVAPFLSISPASTPCPFHASFHL